MPHKSIGGDGMSNKKSKKLINIMLSAMMLLGVSVTPSQAAGAIEYGKNGVAYILLSADFSTPGVYRLNEYNGDVCEPWKLYRTNTITGKVSGLAANQNNEVFLLSAIEGDKFTDAPVGWLPTGIKFKEDSPIYLSVAGPTDGDATDYHREGYPSWHAWPTDGDSSSGQYWKRDQTFDGKKYEYAVNFGGPVGVRFLNGSDGTVGTPIWDGTYKPESKSNAAAIKHPSDPRKVLLPSHVGALSYYLYGTKNDPNIEALPMDGSTPTQEEYTFDKANGAGYFAGDDKHAAGTMFGCIVKRFYQKRENSLNLYSAKDETTSTNKPENKTMNQTQSDVLKTIDVKVKEAYGKLCGDNCIEGGEILGKPVETALSTVTVVTATTGNRYGFNPLGVFKGSNSTDASLRVVKTNGTTKTIDLSTDDAGQLFSDNITNQAYLSARGITPASIKTIGVSSNFDSDTDFIYGSEADYFVVQDSWWGKGGIAYEYYKGDDTNPGKIVKIDYMNKATQTASETLGDLEGKVDAIAIDGDGYLYALKTEEFPLDKDINAISPNPNPELKSVKIGTEDLEVTFTGWRRDQKTTSGSETINDGYIDVPAGQEEPDDYKIATIKQKVYKAVKRYPQATGNLGTEEDRGSLFAGYDTWTNKLKLTRRGYSWDYPEWRQEEGTKASDILAELAVVNVADSPKSVEGTENHYIMVTGSKNEAGANQSYTNNQVIGEQHTLTFKVEGYKPVVGGVQRNFKEIGDIGTKYKAVTLNSIPAEDGTYAHDEDGDGYKSGFPSSMFEATDKMTKVVWKVAQVENTTAVPLSDSSVRIIKRFADKTTVSSKTNPYNEFEYTFSEPCRYIIQAELTYYYFDNFGTAARPDKLTFSTKTITTQPKLVSVYANALKLDKTPSYITNVQLHFDNKKYGIKGTADTKTNLDTVEGEDKNDNDSLIGSFTITFDAQFYKEVNSYKDKDLQTSNGIGVWDYIYYHDLYEKAQKQVPSIIVPTVAIKNHVYNYKGGSTLTTVYDPTIYNPGRAKATSANGGTNTAGTSVDEDPNELDKSFIQWALYLRPIKPQGAFSLEEDTIFDRGILINSGTCADSKVTFSDNGGRNYSVSIPVNNVDSQIDIPRDPGSYTLDLELIYPRVTWLNNDLGANLNDGHNYFSSVVPYTESCGAAPIHVLSRLSLSITDGTVNQSYKRNPESQLSEDGKTSVIFVDKPYITICARDKEKPEFKDNTKNLPYYETTGDPTIPGDFSYRISDNNPFLSVVKLSAGDSLARIAKDENTKNATDLVIQDLITDKFTDDDTNKKYIIRSDAEKKVTSIDQTSDDTSFVTNDNWKIWVDYSVKMNALSPDRFKPTGEAIAPTKMPEKTTQLTMENWIGTLKYAVIGKFYDGYGVNSKYDAHYLYDESVYKNLDSTPSDLSTDNDIAIDSTPQIYLERIDNDPPNVEVELISQSDNRRWKFQLVEGVNDRVSCAKTVDNLAPSKLIVSQYHLNNETSMVSYQADIEGTTAYPENVGEKSVKVDTAMTDNAANVIPSFRRAARLLINVDIFDNCGFKNLGEATIKVENNNSVLLEKNIKTNRSHNDDGLLENDFKDKPRGVFSVDLPMQVSGTQPQLKVTVYAKDHQGNERELVIPVNLVESTFETRVLETKEERK